MDQPMAPGSGPALEGIAAVVQHACMASAKAHGCIAYVRTRAAPHAPWGGANMLFQTGFDPALLDSFWTYYHARNVWARQERARMRPGVAVNSSDLYPDRLLPATEYYVDWLKPQDICYAMGGVLWSRADRQIKLSVVRSRSEGAFSAEDVRVFQAIMPMINATLSASDLLHEQDNPREMLTPAEAAVLELMFQGLCAKEIARERGRSLETVRTQISSVLEKFGCGSQRELLARHTPRRGPGAAGRATAITGTRSPLRA